MQAIGPFMSAGAAAAVYSVAAGTLRHLVALSTCRRTLHDGHMECTLLSPADVVTIDFSSRSALVAIRRCHLGNAHLDPLSSDAHLFISLYDVQVTACVVTLLLIDCEIILPDLGLGRRPLRRPRTTWCTRVLA
jgi:hypothetical protein